MNLNEFLTKLSEQHVQLWADGEQLRIHAPKGVLTPTLRDSLAEYKQELLILLRNKDMSENTASTPVVVPARDQRYQPFPLTDMQQAYWVGGSGVMELGNITARCYFEVESSNLDLKQLSASWQQLIKRHEMLRAVVLPTGEQQILEQVPPFDIKVLDLRGIEPSAAVAHLADVRNQMPHEELITDQWPLFKLRASCLDDQRILLHFSFSLLIVDGKSIGTLLKELFELCQGTDVSLPPLELSYRDYVLGQIAFQDSLRYKQALNYWHNRIHKLPPAPELPLAKSPSALAQPKFVHLNDILNPKAWKSFKAQAAKVGLTPTLALCAAYAEVLACWSKSQDFTLTILYLNRPLIHHQVDDVIGNFSTTVWLEVNNSVKDTFAARAKRLQQQLWSDLEHSIVSGVQVGRELNRMQKGIPRAAMPVTFASLVSNSNSSDQEMPQGLSPFDRMVYHDLQVPQVFIDHQVWETNGALVANWDFVEDLLPEGLVEEMFATYIRFLHRLASEEDAWQEISSKLLQPAQLERQAHVNNTKTQVEEKLLHTLFAEQVSKQSDKAAIVSSTRTLTYQDLYEHSHQLGNQLRSLGVLPNKLVAVVMEKGWEQVVGVLAILMAGGAYVPIDPGLPQELRWQMLEQSEVQLVLTQSWLRKTLEWPENVKLICVDTAGSADTDTQLLELVQKQEDLAYVIFTSGSTGLPKGVMIDHRGAVNTLVDINQRFSVGTDDKVLAVSSLSFDLSVYDIFGTLAAGGTIVLPDASATRDPAHWLDLVMQEQVTVWNSVPALMQMLVEYVDSSHRVLPASLRLVLLSGDWLPLNLPSQIKTLVEDVQVISLGGATEASIWSILYPIETVDPDWNSIPYGQPMVNQQFYILNEALDLRPLWVPGHLYIGGIGLAKGYWRNEEKNHTSFITHPCTGERLYRTGDLGRYLPDGNIEFLGREDFQVKVQGYRIECGEIEAALLQYPGVQAAVVSILGEQQGNKRLAAYVVPSSESTPTPSKLRDFLVQKLPHYMVPAAFMMLDALPLTGNGKVDRKALPEITQAISEPSSAQQLQKKRLEETGSLAQIGQLVSNILKIDRIDSDANLLEIGASSLDILRIANQLDCHLGFRPQIDQFFRLPTVSGLAWAYEQQRPQIEQQRHKLHHSVLNGKNGHNTSGQRSPIVVDRRPAELAWIESSGIYREVLNFLREQLPAYMELAAFELQSSLVGIQPHGSKPPFFCVHPSFGDVLCFLDLVRHLGTDQPFYGLQALGLDGKQEPYTCIKDMASHYIEELRVVQPQGPYFLGGWSSGGIVALEMAKQLESQGQEVKLLALLDSLVMSPERLDLFLDNLRQLTTDEGMLSFLQVEIANHGLSTDLVLYHMHPLMRVFQSNLQALLDYLTRDGSQQTVYSGRVTYFQASEQIGQDFPNPDLALEELAASRVEIQLVPGNHLSMLRQPHVSDVAKHLNAYLQSA